MEQLDCSINKPQNANTCTRECKIMFKENKTYEWLSSKSDAGKYMVVKNAIKKKVDIENEEKKRNNMLQEEYVKTRNKEGEK